MRRSFGGTLALAFAVVAASWLALGSGVALASKVADYFKGHIIVSEKPFPSRFTSDAAFIAHMKKADKTELTCTKDGVWEFHYMAFFAKPLDDVQVSVNLYDLTDDGNFIMGADQYTSARGERILASYFKLTRDEIPSNHKINIVIVHKGKRLAATAVKMRDDRKFKGKVDFGEDET